MVSTRTHLYPTGLFLALPLFSISVLQAGQNPSSNSSGTPGVGQSTFNSLCAACHGLDGRGSDKAVNIAGSAKVRQLSDPQLSSIILKGIPGTGMPAFHSLSQTQVGVVIGYLRTLQGRSGERSLPGDPKRGKEIFFGKGECSTCHTISGAGGFLGPDLTEHAATSSADDIREEIVRAPRAPMPGYREAMVTTAGGDRLEGVVRNEDNFSVQLQTKDGSFYFFKKAELRNFEHLDGSLMPADYRDRLSEAELNDVVSYLMKTPDPGKLTRTQNKKDDLE